MFYTLRKMTTSETGGMDSLMGTALLFNGYYLTGTALQEEEENDQF